MTHDCVDWTAWPPRRKTPLLVLSRGDVHVYTVVPKQLQSLVAIARHEFDDLGEGDVYFTSSCVDLCHGRPARITERAWEHLRPLIGCATVEVAASSSGTNKERERVDDTTSEHENVAPPDNDDESDVPVTRPHPNRGDDDESDASTQAPHPFPHHPSQPIIDEKPTSNLAPRASASDSNPPPPEPEPEDDIPRATQTQIPATDSAEKLLIRVAHPPTKQESKFTTKGTTRVGKVLTGACKSFGLDPSLGTLYLIVAVEYEDGDSVENLFPCDRNDTIARAGAERDKESRFLLKMAGDP